MTGRDHRSFLQWHRSGKADEADRLVNRMTEGLGSSCYTKPNYKHLRTAIIEKKLSGNRSLMKVKQLAALSKASREVNLLKQHRLVWLREVARLQVVRKCAEADQAAFFQYGTSEQSTISMSLLDAEETQLELSIDRRKFKVVTVDPVWNLRLDLQVWLNENSPCLLESPQDLTTKHVEITDTIQFIKDQQKVVLDRLAQEQLSLEQDVNSEYLKRLFAGAEKWVVEGVLPEAKVLVCPDAELRESVLSEFHLLDTKYLARIRDLDKMHTDVLRSDTDGWETNDHFIFQAIVDQYTYDIANRRSLYIDRLRRELPHKTRAQVVAHEEWTLRLKFYTEHRDTLIKCWAGDKQELYHKAVAVFADASLTEELCQVAAMNRERQDEICKQLKEKVQSWREQKLEAIRLEDELVSQQRRLWEERREKREVSDRKRRASDKQMVEAFHTRIQQEQEAKERENQQRLIEIREAMAKQAQQDRDRVLYRDALLKEQRQYLEEKKRKEEEGIMDKECRLKALRDTVQVHVEHDPQRIFQTTKAYNAHLGIGVDEDINIQQPLFDTKGYTSDQVMADPRVKLEQKLRKAGLHTNPYARALLLEAKPLKPPRKDQRSNVFNDIEQD